jgi:PAS domain S-box-containing protein
LNSNTDKTELEESKEVERQFRKILDSVPDGIQIIDFNWQYVYVNNALVGQAKFTQQELLGHTMMEKYPGIEQTAFFRSLRECMMERRPQRLKNEFEYADKSKRWFDCSVEAVDQGILILSTDITGLTITKKEHAFEQEEKEKRAAELILANKELAFQNEEKGKRAAELTIANKELAFQNEEKGKRSAELTIANKELAFQNEEKPAKNTGTKTGVHQKLLFFSFLILAGIGFIGYGVYKSNQKLLDSSQWVQHTEKVIYQSGNILSLAKDVETSSRGFVITNDSSFLKPLYVAEKTIFTDIAQLKELTRDNPSQQQRVDSLDLYMQKRLIFSLRMIELRSTQGLAAAIAYTSTGEGQRYTDHMRLATDTIREEEGTLLKQRKQTNERSAAAFDRFSVMMFILMAVFTILLLIATGNYFLQTREKSKRAAELTIANKELAFQNEEKGKRAAELTVANEELAFQNEEKGKRAAELTIANKELAFQNEEKEKRAAELTIANKELAFQNQEKEKRAAELIIANRELTFQNKEKEKRASELTIANHELAFQNEEKEKRAAELNIANKELVFQNEQKENRAAEVIIAHKELAFQNKEKENRAAELVIANKELLFQHGEKEKRAAELIIANKELVFQNEEKEKRAAELGIANRELKKAEDDIRKLNENLEQKVIKRTAELESVNKELESFSYSVSHDLRSPLRAVHGYARMLNEDYGTQLDPEGNRLMNNILNSAKKMGQLIDDLLSFSRLGRKELVRMIIPMQEMVVILCLEIKKDQDDRDLQFKINHLHPAEGDSIAIKQVWVNLVSNAVKYSKDTKSAIIEISSGINGDEIIYSIRDNGAGFDMRYANKLFGVFQRLHTDEQFEGTGVGLAIVHRIISKHGGRVWAEGKVNEGATFYFSLPNSVTS